MRILRLENWFESKSSPVMWWLIHNCSIAIAGMIYIGTMSYISHWFESNQESLLLALITKWNTYIIEGVILGI